jgi:hypothetical protein
VNVAIAALAFGQVELQIAVPPLTAAIAAGFARQERDRDWCG